jgi:hypothetical protein
MVDDLLHCEAQFRDNLPEGNAFVVIEPFPQSFDVAPFFFGDRLVIHLNGCQSAIQRIEQEVQQPDDSGELFRGQTLDHAVRVLLLPAMSVFMMFSLTNLAP